MLLSQLLNLLTDSLASHLTTTPLTPNYLTNHLTTPLLECLDALVILFFGPITPINWTIGHKNVYFLDILQLTRGTSV